MSGDRTIEAAILARVTAPEGVTVVVADPFITVSGERDMRAAFTAGDMLLATPLAPGNPFLPEPRKLRVASVTQAGPEVVPHDAPRNRRERRKAASKRR